MAKKLKRTAWILLIIALALAAALILLALALPREAPGNGAQFVMAQIRP